ncbi:unnamed protein product [Discosporangium mesarthrocarpum]
MWRSRPQLRTRYGSRLHMLFPMVVGAVSGYYIFNEPLKEAAAKIKAAEASEGSQELPGKEARDR